MRRLICIAKWQNLHCIIAVGLLLNLEFVPRQTGLEDMEMEEDMKTLVSDEIKKFRLSYQVGWYVRYFWREHH